MSAVSSPVPEQSAKPRRSLTTVAAFFVGLPLAAGVLWLFHSGPLQDTPLVRYVSNEVEWAAITLFCCAISALAAKLLQHVGEWRSKRIKILPEWDGKPQPVGEATSLLAAVTRLPRSLQNTYLVNRVASALEFVSRRGSAVELDDHLRDQADADSLTLENSYALVRFITWAIPILGFLGTVLGITQAISGVTPEQLETNLSTVTDGLALAFDSTAVALTLTMVTMFFTYVVDRIEQGHLESVDQYAARHLAHRFERPKAEGNPASEDLLRRQTELWADVLAEVDRRRAELEHVQHERLTATLETALERTLVTHGQRLTALEDHAVEQSQALVMQISRLTETIASQTTTLAQLQEGEKQLIRLQELLQQNLDVLAGAATFEQAVQSLTAAVHLLSARTTGFSTHRPGAAA